MLYLLIVIVLATFEFAAYASEYHSPHTSNPLNFHMQIIDDDASGAYGLIGQDITQNGYTDLVSFAYNGVSAGQPEGEIYWYEFQPKGLNNQTMHWKKHFITKKKHVVHGAFMDVDYDGFEDLIFMSDFEVPIKNPKKEGNIWWAKRPQDLNAHEWRSFWIGSVPGAHRIITADLAGTGQKQVVVVPLYGQGRKPIYGGAAITVFSPQKNPKLPWTKTTFPLQKFHSIHDAITIHPKKGQKRQAAAILIASKEGMIQLSFAKDADHNWLMKTNILHNTPQDSLADLQARDKGIIPLGRKQNDGWQLSGITSLSPYDAANPFIAAIDYTQSSSYLKDEPWHGDTVALYRMKNSDNLDAGFSRQVLEKRSAGGHAVQVIDLNHDGYPDILAGFRAYPTALVAYLSKKVTLEDGHFLIKYEKQIISERSANAIVIGNWTKDGVLSFATAGFGHEGDPYILMWTSA